MAISRRFALQLLAGAALLPLGLRAASRAQPREIVLTAGVTRQQLVPPEYPDTEVWSFNGTVPGPELRFRQGDKVRIVVENRLPRDTTVHWHGLRVPNAMDGVPHMTQPPIAPGGRFVYEFELPDAGSYWYHPHTQSNEQVARGLYGAFIVEERSPIRVDRDATWILSDWRLTPDAAQAADFDSGFDLTHGGRIGNTITVNGRFPGKDGGFPVRSGERIRLRLISTAVARVFSLQFEGHEPRVISLDGQPVEPHAPEGGSITLGPGMRADVVLDCMLGPGARTDVSDGFYRNQRQRVGGLVYGAEAPLRTQALDAPVALAPNPLAEPDVARAERHRMVLQGGAMGRLREAEYDGQRLPLAKLFRAHQLAWAINGVAVKEHARTPLLTLRRDGHYVLAIRNDTAWPHPMHLHGHVFRVISRAGRPTRFREWGDTVFLDAGEEVEIAFVADNPGDWMFHCHVLAHQQGGMTGTIRVA